MLLCEFATLNGGEQSLLATLPAILAAGFEVSVALPESGPLVDRLQELNIPCVPFSLFDVNAERLKLKAAREQLAELLLEHRPDLLHANSLAMGRLAGPVAHKLKLRSIAHLRDILRLRQQVIQDLNYHQRLLAVSHATRDFHVEQGLSPANTQVLYNGVDLDRFKPRPATGYLHQELSIPSSAPLVALIGQIGLRKDPLTFLRAGAELAKRHTDTHFLVIGERFSEKEESRELESELHAFAELEELRGRVHFLGVREDIATLLPELSLLFHPAWQEPLGRVLLEAAASGVAIIASDVGGTPEIFPPEAHSAALFPAGDVPVLSGILDSLLQDEASRRNLQQQARLRAVTMFDIRQRSAELIEVYEAVLSDSGESIQCGER